MSQQEPQPADSYPGMRAFYIMGLGQFVSIFSTQMTAFAITLWAWELTGSATALVLVGISTQIPTVILSPVAGTLIDRWNRKLIMALSDLGSALATLVLLLLFITNRIEIWHLYAAGIFSGIFGSFQYPAYSAVVTTMVPKEQLSRANSIRTIIVSASETGAPLLAGGLITFIQISGIMVVDLATFFVAIGTLLLVRIPQPAPTDEGEEAKGSILSETLFGLQYIRRHTSLLAIIALFTISNIGSALCYPMMSPLILARTGSDPVILGTVRSIGSVGFLVGGLITSVWPGPKKKIYGINVGFILLGLSGAFVFGTGQTLPAWIVGAFFLGIFIPIINSFYIAILQAKVAPDVQGRVFGLEHTLTVATFPLGQLIAGPAADYLLEPAMSPGGRLADLFGWLVGTGPGAGIGLLILISGLISLVVGLAGFAIRSIREIETLMPDHEAIRSPAEQS